MVDYAKLYAILCGAIDDELEVLGRIPLAYPSACRLRQAILQTEKLYVENTEDVTEFE